jgi:hypothetical protein
VSLRTPTFSADPAGYPDKPQSLPGKPGVQTGSSAFNALTSIGALVRWIRYTLGTHEKFLGAIGGGSTVTCPSCGVTMRGDSEWEGGDR